MGFEKIDIITGTLKDQVQKFEKVAEAMKADMHEHKGAESAFQLLVGQMPSFAAGIEERIEKDLELGSAAESVRVYAKNIIKRFMAMCESNQKAQNGQFFVAQGRMQAAEQTVKSLKGDIETHVATAKNREEKAEAERKAYQDGKKPSKDNSVPEKGKKSKAPAKKRTPRKKRTTKKPAKAKATPDKKPAKTPPVTPPVVDEGVSPEPKTGDTDTASDGNHT